MLINILPMRILFIILSFLIISTSLKATKVYNLSPDDDLASFIVGLKSEKQDHIIINLSPGTYYLKNTIRFNVEHCVPITIVGRGKAVISGAAPIVNWEVMHNGFWRTKQPVANRIQQLNVNGVLATRARTPNEGTFNLESGQQVSRNGNEVIYKAVLSEEFAENLKAIGNKEQSVINLFRLFTHSKANIKSVGTKDRTLQFTEKYTQSYFTPSKSTGVILENYYKALDAPGEWYQDSDGYVYYVPRKSERVNVERMSAVKLKNLVTISGAPGNLAGNITFKGIVFEGCDVVGSDTGIPPYQSAYTLDAAVFALYARQVNITDCEFRGLGGYAIWLMNNCENCTVSGNYIHDIGGGGIKVGGLDISESQVSKRITVNNNVIERFGRIYMGATGILLTYAQNSDISHNEISDGYYTGISVGFSWGYGKTPTHSNTIAYNKITKLGQGLLNDMAGIYTLGVSPGTVINNNVISEVKSRFGDGFGIYTDEGSSDILIENNVAYNCSGGGFHQHYGSNNIVRNNIFAFGDKANLLISSVKKSEDVQLTFENNIVLVAGGEAMSGDALKSGRFVFKDNCFYDVNGRGLTVNGSSLDTWMSSRNHTFQTSDPRLRRPEKGDVRFKSRRVARKIGFKTIETSKVGADWRP